MTKIIVVAAALAAAGLVLTGCGGQSTPHPTEQPTAATEQPTAAPVYTPPPPARSSILDLTMPDGTFALFHTDDTPNYKHEVWRAPSTGVDSAAAALRAQLPVGAPLDGIPWCAESHRAILGPRAAMFWYSDGGDQPAISVVVEEDDTTGRLSDGSALMYIDISRWVSSHDTCGDTRGLEQLR